MTPTQKSLNAIASLMLCDFCKSTKTEWKQMAIPKTWRLRRGHPNRRILQIAKSWPSEFQRKFCTWRVCEKHGGK